MQTLLIEVRAEEIPAGYIRPALAAFQEKMTTALDAARIDHGAMRVYGTPRRLTLRVEGVADTQRAQETELTGPPKKVAYDADGNLTMAGQKFAEKAGVPAAELTVKTTPRGEYLCARVSESVAPTGPILEGILPGLILSLPFPKSMRWGDLSVTFARPIQSILALLGEEILSFTVGDVTSGNTTAGHRFKAPGQITIPHPDAYVDALRNAWVLVDMDARRQCIETAVTDAGVNAGGAVIPDPALLDTVTQLVEYPQVITGAFEPEFLDVPREVLITSMREHQKYFAVSAADGTLLPVFIAVSNMPADDMSLIRTGNERVLRARLSDAQFFFHEDKKDRMEDWVERLKGVLFQADLGSVYDKVVRVRSLAGQLAALAELDAEDTRDLDRAALLCKADLVSQMVYEFTDLQGIMGRVYALEAGEHPGVATAIEEHYRPVASGAELPASRVGSLLSLAEKLDTLCGCFSAGLIPTGASDPYALRRQTIGLIQILQHAHLRFSLSDLVNKGLAGFMAPDAEGFLSVQQQVLGFVAARLTHLLVDQGHAKDGVAAVIAASADRVPDVNARVQALEAFKTHPAFPALSIALKRVGNLIRKSGQAGGDAPAAAVSEALFEDPTEGLLLAAIESVTEQVNADIARGDYPDALAAIATLGKPVDAFFEAVLVMAEDPKVRANRLALLKKVADLLTPIADFTQLVTG
ncbi:MAG: glycine--tRNA ligase subunit beta [Deltaproteobacteria bacterium]|nr:MAG: glycine--tRNA ligase subunit beta [Deltaproteobacteria bacterium]